MKKMFKHLIVFSLFVLGYTSQAQTYNMTNTVITTCSGNFYDDGGIGANYYDGQNLTQTFTAPTPNYRMRVVFNSFNTEANYDSLSVYDGTTTAASNFLAKYTGSTTPLTHYSTNESITFHFVSDVATNNAGWDAIVSCFGLTNVSPTAASQSQNVVLTVNGSNTEFGVAPSPTSVFLRHTVTTNTISTAAITVINNTQLTANIAIPCNADAGQYDLFVDQPGVGLTKLANAFTVSNFQLNYTTVSPSCFGGNNGAITTNVIGGTAGYSYYWQPGSMTTSNVSGLTAGTYSCNLTDGLGCIRSVAIVLTEPSAIAASASQTNVSCWGLANGAIAISVTGGVPSYIYNWLPNGGTTANATGLTDGVYTCNIQDANGCGANFSYTITQPAQLTSSVAVQNNPTCFGYTNGNAVIGTNGGTAPHSYSWFPSGGTSSSATGLGAGNYSCTVTDANGCTSVTNLTLNQPPAITVNAGSDVAICSGTTITNLSSSTFGGNPGYNFNWVPSTNLGSPTAYSTTASPSTSITYTLNVTDASGCTGSDDVMITVYPLPTVSIIPSANNICAGITITLTANAPTATSVLWNNASTSFSITDAPLSNASYSVTATDFNGCSDFALININVTPRKNISGNVINESAGTVVLYKYSSSLSLWDSIISGPIFTNTYAFAGIDSGQYVIKVLPGTSTNQTTYGTNSISWFGATVINHGCTNHSVQSVTVVPFANIGTGTGSMSGQIIEANGFGNRPDGSSFKPTSPGNPIGGIVVKGGRNPGGQMFTQTLTDPVTGTYTLSGIPDGTDYFILVDIPGLDTNLTYHRDLVSGNNQLTGLDFTVDSIYINPIANAVGINDLNVIDHQLMVYPNPASQFININYDLKKPAAVSVEIMDVIGRTAKTLITKTIQHADKYKQQFSIAELNSGVYFIKLSIAEHESIIKFIIAD